MAFWGVEIKPGKPYTHGIDKSGGRLHISQATLGFGKASSRISSVECKAGNNSRVLLCSLIPDKTESCLLDLEFEEDYQVVFSIIGIRSIHLTGYYLRKGGVKDGDDTDSFGEDIGDTESEQYSDSEDEYEDDFIDDDDDIQMSSSPYTAAVTQEIFDDGFADRKRRKKKYQVSDSDGESESEYENRIIPRGGTSIFESDSEDEDVLPISSIYKTKAADASVVVEEISDKKVINAKDSGDGITGSKRKIEIVVQDSETKRGGENAEKPKKKKKNKRSKEGIACGVGDDSMIDVHKEDKAQFKDAKTDHINQKQSVRYEADEKLSNDKSVEIDAGHVADEDNAEVKKKKKKKNKTKESDKSANTKQPSEKRSYPNGLVDEDLEMSKPDRKRASPGKKVSGGKS